MKTNLGSLKAILHPLLEYVESLPKEGPMRANCWLYAERWDFAPLTQRTKLPEESSGYYKELALPVYEQWRSQYEKINGPGTIIPPPSEKITIEEYLPELHLLITQKNEKRVKWMKSFFAFLQSIRDDTDPDQQGVLEVLFPREMIFVEDYRLEKIEGEIQHVQCTHILRGADAECSPIDMFATSDIVENLVRTVLKGRPNAQHRAAEALGFAWVCITVGRANLMTLTQLKLLYNLPLSALTAVQIEKAKQGMQPEHFLTIGTLYGPIAMPISKFLHDFLIALPRSEESQKIFSKAPESRLNALYNKGVKPSNRTQKLQKITFRTLLSGVHSAEGYRSLLKKRPHKFKRT